MYRVGEKYRFPDFEELTRFSNAEYTTFDVLMI
jgi:hypothetical protein